MINRAYATGYYDNGSITAGNFTVAEFSWLPCVTQKAMAYKVARIDSDDPSVIWYRLGIKNNQGEGRSDTLSLPCFHGVCKLF